MPPRRLNKVLATLPAVQHELDKAAHKAGRKASRLLAQHRHSGDAQILVERGRVDRYVILSDDRGQRAALSIEYGRDAYTVETSSGTRRVGGMEGLFILHRALGLRG